jgi:hypothetical protein
MGGDLLWLNKFHGVLSEWLESHNKGGRDWKYVSLPFTEREAELLTILLILRYDPECLEPPASEEVLRQHPELMANACKASRRNESMIERSVLKLIEESVAKDTDLDTPIRETLLELLRGQLGFRLTLKRKRGSPPQQPESAILETMRKELADGGNLESAYAAAERVRRVSRSRAQQVAKKHKLRAATKSR